MPAASSSLPACPTHPSPLSVLGGLRRDLVVLLTVSFWGTGSFPAPRDPRQDGSMNAQLGKKGGPVYLK
ncbi:hypothetical protein ZHAS_00021976 [Anopheles sinensis]|uniref:Uncharacterized protein n=1 Tax=Anopheles sinensis TaxID=74873 RepID=A0A084WTC5_ANOSI|nr:hypothetical protein ZHAS_00021976 [Anopheles sinensis]